MVESGPLTETGLPPAVAVHDGDEATRIAHLAVAAGRPATLLSLPGGGLSLGAGTFQAIAEQARTAAPTAKLVAALDCLDAPGIAVAAIQHGLDAVICSAGPAEARLADIAAQYGTTLLNHRPAAIRADANGPAIAAWLGAGPPAG